MNHYQSEPEDDDDGSGCIITLILLGLLLFLCWAFWREI